MSLEWRAGAVESDGDVPTPTTWHDVEVPGRPARFAGSDAVAYRTEFADPLEGDEKHALLVLEGVYAHARVWLNGEQVAEHDAYFDPLQVPLPVAEDNELVVECRAPEDRFGGVFETDRVPDESAVPGIWWGAELETHPDPYVESLDVVPRVDGERAAVDVEATVVTDDPLDDRVTLSLRPEGDAPGGGTMDRARVDTGAGRATVTREVAVRSPSLWWPHDAGGQPRYVVRAKLEDAERTTVTGLRSVEYGEAGLVVNGQRVAPRGINLTVGDRPDVGADPADVERVVDANANLVRAPAHVLSPSVYEACDERGVLVWQDLPLTGPGEFDVDRGRVLANRLEAARSNHPSLAAVSVHDDPVADFVTGLDGGFLDRLRYRWRAWRASYDPEPARTVADAVDDVPTFPVVGPAGVDHDATTTYPGWSFGEPQDLEWLRDRYGVGEVVAEFGAGSVAAETDDRAPDFDREAHAARVDGGVDEPRAYQARVVGEVAERLRLSGADVLAAYALRDVGDAGMGVLTRDGTEKPAFDRLAAAYQPVQAVLADPSPGESDVVVVHDRPASATVTVEWDVGGEREQTEAAVEAYGRTTVTTLSLDGGDAVTIAVADGDGVTHNEYRI